MLRDQRTVEEVEGDFVGNLLNDVLEPADVLKSHVRSLLQEVRLLSSLPHLLKGHKTVAVIEEAVARLQSKLPHCLGNLHHYFLLGRPFEHRPALMEVRENPYGARARYVQAKGQEHTHLVVQKDLSAAAQGGRAQSRTDGHHQAAAARYNQSPIFGSRDKADEGRGVPGRLAKLVDDFLAGLFLCFPTGLVVVLTLHVSREEGQRRLGIFLDQHLHRCLLLLQRQFIG